jgi:hypothetical protein
VLLNLSVIEVLFPCVLEDDEGWVREGGTDENFLVGVGLDRLAERIKV